MFARPSLPRPPRRLSRRSSRRACLCLAAAACAATLAPPALGGVSCDRTKKYRLSPRNGPWTVMVATFLPLRGGNPNGKTPEQAADELVYELRESGVPAVAWEMDSRTQTLSTTSRDGKKSDRVMATVRGGVCVLAGNFPAADDPKAEAALAWIKNPRNLPACLRPNLKKSRGWTGLTEGGGIFKLTPGRNDTPLARAFLTVNPLLPPDRVRALTRRRDPLVVRLNSGVEHTLTDCPGRYTLVIAQFRGNTIVQVAGTDTEHAGEDAGLSTGMDKAGREAWELCQVLRNRDGEDAYVWHERYRSVVAVGAFDRPDDPALLRLARDYGERMNPDVKQVQPHKIVVPKGIEDLRKAKRIWLLEAKPFPMAVPEA